MLSFKEFITEKKKAKDFINRLLENAAHTEKFQMTEDERKRMDDILKMFPDILKRNGPEHTTHLGSKAKPNLEDYDMKRVVGARRRKLRL